MAHRPLRRSLDNVVSPSPVGLEHELYRLNPVRVPSVAFGSSVYAGGINPMAQYFQVGPLTVVSGLSLYVLGFA